MERQLEGIRAGAHVIVGTPGRVLDHLRRRTLDFDGVQDARARRGRPHARHGLRGRDGPDHGVHAARSGRRCCSRPRCRSGIRGLIYHYLAEPEWVLLSEDQIYVKEVEHLYCLTPRLHKEATLYKLLEYENPASSMIFCNTRGGDAAGLHLPARQGPAGGDALLRPAAEEAREGDGARSARARSATW